MNSPSKIKITISYGYDIHSLTVSENEFEDINNGGSIEFKGQGFSIEGEVVQDTWYFANKKLRIACENGFEVFEGTLDDISSEVLP